MKISHRLQLDELNARHAAEPEWWEGCLIRIEAGDCIWDIAQEYLYHRSVLRNWIRADEKRETAYIDAMDRRKEGWIEQLQTRTARAAFASVDQALTGDGGALEIGQWPPALLAACDTAEFGPNGQIYKVKMDAGKASERLAKYVGLDKAGDVNVNVYSLVGILQGLPKAGVEKQIEAEDAILVSDAGESAQAATPAGNLLPVSSPRQAVPERTLERV